MRDLKITTSTILTLAALGSAVASPGKRWPPPSPSLELKKYDQEIFDVAMQLGDWSWEPSTGHIKANDDGVSPALPSSDECPTDRVPGAYQYQIHRLVRAWAAVPKRG
jgi:hypothetical protein